MQGKTEIKIDGLAYGIIFNNLAIMEAVSRFKLNPLNGSEFSGIFTMLKVIYCGMYTFAEMNGKEVVTYEKLLEAYAKEEVKQVDIFNIMETFTQSKVISDTLQKANELAGESKKKVSPKKK
jgi:hypothetical protein